MFLSVESHDPSPFLRFTFRLFRFSRLIRVTSIRVPVYLYACCELETLSFIFPLSFSYLNLHNGSLERPLSLGCPERLRWCFLHGCMLANTNSFPPCPILAYMLMFISSRELVARSGTVSKVSGTAPTESDG